ncbi:MAG: aminoglycoside phosphotransferase family protein [Candidatus Bipolaricaulia bacterium]
MERHKIVGRGRTAEILAWGDGRVLKLYREGSSRRWVQREADVSRFVHRAGLSAPAVYDSDAEDGLYEVDGRFGILYEWIDGPTMLRDLGRRPWMVVTDSKALAALHAQVHSVSGDGLPNLRERIEWGIDDAAEWLSDDLRAAARSSLARLPEGSHVCHGDFHPDNVLLQEGGPVIVDWGPASCGHPAADVAWTVLLYRFGSPVGAPLAVRLFLSAFRKISLRIYLRTYSRLTGTPWSEIRRWLGVIAVLRLTDRIPEERDALIRLIRAELEPREE